MTEKILILNRKRNTLEIRDEDNALSYSYIGDVTHIEKDKTEYGILNRIFVFLNGDIHVGFITNVKEVREDWGCP